jgi:hypothetical protein
LVDAARRVSLEAIAAPPLSALADVNGNEAFVRRGAKLRQTQEQVREDEQVDVLGDSVDPPNPKL